MKDMIVEETSYADSNALKVDNEMDDATPRKTHTKTYVLGNKLNKISFNDLSDDDDNVLILLASKFSGAKHLPAAELRVLDKCDFGPVKFFVLNVELLAVPGKTNRTSTPSKFLGIIRFFFTSELSLKKARELATHEKIVVNVDVRQVNKHSDQVIVVKEIPVNLSRSAVESVFAKFSKIKTLVEFELPEVANLHRALLYTLPVGTTVYNLSGLLDSYGEKTCFIGCNPSSYVHDRCVVVCFANKESKLAVIGSNPVFKGMAGSFSSCMAPLSLVAETSLFASALLGDYDVYSHLASLECFLELLANQVSGILEKLGSIKLVPLVTTSDASPSTVLVSVISGLDLDMVLDGALAISNPFPPVISNTASIISSSSSKVLTTKVGGLESKIVALEVLIESVLEKLDCLCSGLDLSAAFIS
ncbi:hypothetical protein G9A89_023945 [Geosiphon pyriformis]|nr:hypothetical protein G9A89_023945 [Geosiphon pyriformis]